MSDQPASRGVVLTSAELDGVSHRADWSYWLTSRGAELADDRPIDSRRWLDDLTQVTELGADEVMITAEWARLEPEPGHHDVVTIAVLRQILTQARECGLRVWLCLVDGTLPGWLTYDEHWFSDSHVRNLLWPRHVEWIGETFGDLVDGWVPIREPGQLASRARLLDLAPPGGTNTVKAAEAIRDVLLAEATGWRVLRGSAPVATYQSARRFVPDKDQLQAEREVRDLDELLFSPWLDGLVDGRIQVGDLPARHAPGLRDAFDQVFVQLRPPVRVDNDGAWSPVETSQLIPLLADSYDRIRSRIGERPVVAVADLAPLSGEIESARADYLGELMARIAEVGVDRWWQSSPIDAWHWEAGRSLQPGIISRDRTPRAEAAVFGRPV